EFVFVIVHGGHEYYNLPSPRMQKQYRFYAEQGADIIVGHHTHCINGNEIYKNTPIYYSLGNFLFTKSNSHDDWYSGLILEVNINKSKLTSKVHPVKQAKGDYKLSLASGPEKAKILNKIQDFNEIILDEDKLAQEWLSLVNSKYHQCINHWFILRLFKHKYFLTIFRKIGLTKLIRKVIALTLNLIRCEAHVDISRSLLMKYLNK
ncbi:MAG TPA: CapA family protein, partial [Chitinophagaceae bacterium]|nr:CapA family protein [Chitinophagaceae bacterium]